MATTSTATGSTTTGSTATGSTNRSATTRAARRDAPPARPDTGAPGTARARALTLPGLVDAAALVAMFGAAAVGLGPVWGGLGYLVPAVGGLLVGLVVAWLGAWRRWPAVGVLVVAVGAYVLFGGVLALPRTAIGGVFPSLRTVRDVLSGAVTGWREIVTTVPPLHSFPDLAVVPYLLMLLGGLLAGTIAWRARHGVWALVPVVVVFVAVILVGTVIAAMPVAQGLVLGVVALLWGSWRVTSARMGTHQVTTESSASARRRLWWHRGRTGSLMLAVGGVTAALVAPLLLPSDPRAVVRETVVPPLDLHEYVSPLVGFRKYTKDLKEEELFTVTGLTEDFRLRLAALDTYDGTVYDASTGGDGSGVYSRAGSEIISTAPGTPVELEVEITGYSGVWLPDLGSVTGIVWSGPRADELADATYYNATTSTGLVTSGMTTGDSYRLSTRVVPVPSEESLRDGTIERVRLPALPEGRLPGALAQKSEQFMGKETDPVKRLFLLRDGLVASGVYSSGLESQPPSRPGHSADRIDVLLAADEMVGDDEQFAVALALMANQAGIPARVVMGFYPEQGTWKEGTPYVATGGDVHAWVEVPFEGYGWVPITAIPDEDNKIEPQPKNDQVPKPPVLEEPEPPEEPAKEEASTVDDEKPDDVGGDGFDWSIVLLVGVAVLVPLILLALPVVLVVAYKARRRLRRRRAERLVDRISGGWAEVLDTAADLGTVVPGGMTRREGAGMITRTFGGVATTRLAHRADATVFGASDPTPSEIDEFWGEVDEVVTGMRATVPRRARLRAALSLRSVGARGERRTIMLRRPGRKAPTRTEGTP